jgi:micrococcal nuclease
MRRSGLSGASKALLILVLLASAAGLLWRMLSPLAPGISAAERTAVRGVRVEKVFDGDTLAVHIDGRPERVRLLGVDTPELGRGDWAGEYYAEQATTFVREFLAGGEIELEPDPQREERDKYGRLLRYVSLPDGRSLNEQLLRDGYAYVFTRFPFSRSERFLELEREAREAGRGVWADRGMAELDWLRSQGARPISLQQTGNRSWAIVFGGRVKPHVRTNSLVGELNRLRYAIEENAGAELDEALRDAGYRPLRKDR